MWLLSAEVGGGSSSKAQTECEVECFVHLGELVFFEHRNASLQCGQWDRFKAVKIRHAQRRHAVVWANRDLCRDAADSCGHRRNQGKCASVISLVARDEEHRSGTTGGPKPGPPDFTSLHRLLVVLGSTDFLRRLASQVLL